MIEFIYGPPFSILSRKQKNTVYNYKFHKNNFSELM